ncbi:DUF4307 domain-containing protein [Mycolicibacterium flavescens]|uniref:DUF4307 domain-containing protein n=1 Tax=Mycolicibacterium flavescens TaxID=1776 RepID=A0A1E3RCD7_MYCFV|nr:DUF4307 domain-containing protein [Mycolicibacterium flavescens]MCV7283000.1 DUF4307 domain-containing protein [Mycolicibacterium flavescens]ODQ87560.1 hypothetical protein BHQ18_23450 [Mycolicibacterium flavescens]
MIERPAARYGRQRLSGRRRRWAAIALTALALVAGVVVALVASARFGSSDVTGEVGAYELLGDDTVSVTITVTRKDPSRPVTCIVRARSVDGSETGRREVLVPPSTEKTVLVTTEVTATRQPALGDIYGCGVDVPPYLVSS